MKYKSNELNVVYCSSDLFSEVCAVSIVSLFENNKSFEAINVFVIDEQISKKNKDRIMDIAYEYGRNIQFIPSPSPSDFYSDERFTKYTLGNTYARMILGDIIPQDVERILSLDSDTIVLDKLDELWNIKMAGHPIAGVDDCMGRKAIVKTQHLKEDATHCNAGMLLIDLSIWRYENWTQLFYNYIKNLFDKGISLGGYEEEVINQNLGDRMLVLPPKFNLMTLEQVLSYEELWRFRGPLKYYSKEEIEEAKSNPIITHTTNFFYIEKRIFEENSDHPMRPQYEKYRNLTPWRNDLPMTRKPTARQFLAKKVWHWMPRFLAIRVAKFVRDEIRPRMEKKRDDQ